MNRIAQLRKEYGLSQQELANRLKVHQTAISQWEKERTAPNFDMVCQISALFNVSPIYLMGNASERGHFYADQTIDAPEPVRETDSNIDRLLMQRLGGLTDEDKQLVLAMIDRLRKTGEESAAVITSKGPYYLYNYPDSAEPPSQPTPAPPEGKDTTPPGPPPESAKNGG